MKTVSSEEMACQACGEIVVMREYEGLEGSVYHSHRCLKMADWMRANPTGDLFIKVVPA